jgi:hypothetical protein
MAELSESFLSEVFFLINDQAHRTQLTFASQLTILRRFGAATCYPAPLLVWSLD